MAKSFLLAIAFLCLTTAARAADIVGTWTGNWTKADDPLPVTVTFAESGNKITGSFESDALQAAGIPFSQVTASGDKLHVVLTGDSSTTTFDGTIAKDRIEGTFAEGTVKGTFLLSRAAPPLPLLRHEVSFTNAGTMLAGEVILPPTPGRHPAILFLHGSGAEGRWASRFLAQKFARAGFVALIYDKRGVGASTGDWKNSGFDDLAGDAVAGVRYLAALPEVDAARVGIYGHSQGGTIAPLVAERARTLAFVIGSAASGMSPAELEIYSLENSIGAHALPPAEQVVARRFIRELVAVAYDGTSRTNLDAMAKEFKDRAWYFDPPPPGDFYWSFSRRIANYRPLDHWRATRAPVLLLFGAKDERVPPRRSADAITAALKAAGNSRVTLRIFPNADHTFKIVSPSTPDGWSKCVPDYANTMVNWALAQNS